MMPSRTSSSARPDERGPIPIRIIWAVCTVDAGQEEVLNIVCGAPNVAAGQKVPVALVGTTMPGGMVIKKAKLRGRAFVRHDLLRA